MTETDLKEKNTKDKILETANILFAERGFGNTSIRDIAGKAGVNLSAVNYHFKSKEILYWKVFDYNYEKISLAVEQISRDSSNVEDMAVKFLEFFIEDGKAIKNTMKIFLSDTADVPDESLALDKPNEFGPPGQKFFIQKLKEEIPATVPIEECKWAINTIFCLTCHMGMFLNTSLAKNRYIDKPEFSHEHKKNELRKSARLYVEHLNKT